MLAEETISLVRAYKIGKLGSLVVVIPKEVRDGRQIKKGQRFLCKVDSAGRIIYEPLNPIPLTDVRL